MNIGSFKAYITPPMVYIMPPARSHPKAARGSVLNIWENARQHAHPIAIYRRDENHFGHVIQRAFTAIPTIAMPHARDKSGIPTFGSSATRHIGVYVPAISTKIIIWSIFLKILSPLGDSLRE